MKLIVIILLSLLSLPVYSASKMYQVECRGAGDSTTVYSHSRNSHYIHFKFDWSKDESHRPAPGQCRHLNIVGGEPYPNILEYKNGNKHGYAIRFILGQNSHKTESYGLENSKIDRYLMTNAFQPKLMRFCVSHKELDVKNLVIDKIRYVKGYKIKKLPKNGKCH